MTPPGAAGPGSPPDDTGRRDAPAEDRGGTGELPADAAEFLTRLARGVQRHGLYPAGHPALDPVVDDVLEGLQWMFSREERLPVAVSREQMVLPQGETAPDHPLFSSLAERLHQHDLARVTFLPGTEAGELGAFMAEVAARPEEEGATLGSRPAVADDWPHLLLEPIRYERLSMAEEGPELAEVETVEASARDLWMGLARTVLADDAMEQLGDDGDVPTQRIVAALERISSEEGRARQAAARMLALVRGLWHAEEGEEEHALRERLVEIVETVDPAAMGSLVGTLSTDEQRELLRATTEWLSAGTVVDLLEEIGGDPGKSISYQMLRLLSKLASYVELNHGALDPEAGAAFRDQVRRLVSGWQADIEGRSRGRAVGRLGLAGPGGGTDRVLQDPERIVQMALEVDRLGPMGTRAVDDLREREGVVRILELLRDRPDGEAAAGDVWARLETEDAVREVLRREPPDFDALDDLIGRMGAAAAPPMLDTLSESGSRSTRGKLFSRLIELEGDIHAAVLERLDDDRWFVQRNMLALLEERGERPDDFSALPFTRHERDAVRREAYKLAFREAGERGEALQRALADGDPKVVSLALAALKEAPPSEVDAAVPVLRRRLDAGDLSPDLARQAVRELGRARSDEALRGLLDLCRTRKMWKFWTTDLAEKSPLVLEALRALADGWEDRSEAAAVLRKARRSADPEVRRSAGGAGREGDAP